MFVSSKSYRYYALCEHLRLIFKDDNSISSLLDSISSDIESAYDKLENLPG